MGYRDFVAQKRRSSSDDARDPHVISYASGEDRAVPLQAAVPRDENLSEADSKSCMSCESSICMSITQMYILTARHLGSVVSGISADL